MIIKKPYAFLIKNFRLFHGILMVALGYLFLQCFGIASFYSSYASQGNFGVQTGMASLYVGIPVFIACVITIVILFLLYSTLSVKKKNNKIYLFSFLFYMLLLAYFIYMRIVFSGLETKGLSAEIVGVFRDASYILLIPQVLIFIMATIRLFGFNIKQFDFQNDLDELKIDTTDNEEVEITLGTDSYKYGRSVRKGGRELKYLILENKAFIIAVASIIVVVISIKVYTHYSNSAYNKSYRESDSVIASSLQYSVEESYFTNTDTRNFVISDKKYYLLVNVLISNKVNRQIEVNRNTFRIYLNGRTISPAFNLSDKFKDIGNAFEPTFIRSGVDERYTVVFEIDNSEKFTECLFRIKDGTSFKDILIKPKDLNSTKDEGRFNMGDTINLNNSMLKNSSVTVKSYSIAEKFKEKYMVTFNNEEKEFTYSIISNSTDREKKSIIKINSNIIIDQDIYIGKNIKTPADLFNYYGLITYSYDGYEKTYKLNKLNVDYEKETLSYLEVPPELEKAEKIDLILLIRGVKYTISLK